MMLHTPTPPYTIPADIDPEVRGLLRRTRSILEQGWCQDAYFDERGNHCLMGAMLAATGLNLYNVEVPLRTDKTFKLAEHMLENVLGDTIIEWNDVEGRTQQQVLSVLAEFDAE